MRVLLLAASPLPGCGPTPVRADGFARALAAAGHDVRVLGGAAGRPAAVDETPGAGVERVQVPARGRAALVPALAGPRPDLVLAGTPPLALGLVAWLAARRHRAPLVLDCLEDRPRAALARGEASPGAGTRLLGALARFLQLRAARVLALTPEVREALESRGLDAGRIVLLPDADAAGRHQADARLVEVLEETHRLARGRPLAPVPGGPAGFAKRTVDVVAAALLLLLLSPLLLGIALAIRLDTRGPALFRQRRVGRGSREFTIVKFRTMRVGTPDLASHLMGPGSDRVTRVGRLLRRTSLDELPQLFNVLAGDMTLVGPRPALHNQDDLIALRQQGGVDALRPGVTGWAQIHGRDDIPLDRKVAYDRWYLAHQSFALDLWIALRTPFALFSSRGVY
jgi:O-antigen biosynthesis protein WbqP